eukprot:CAMPEP_0179253392 /NCGR_PEP_ID=MMETSP0797-20121207/22703_1 /TAXON_ID=47934 /ORGANISM="Dinophysis acuminata, Strain DAEP01" /LENGTH=276 /DNA_ID=CAMNT_0020961245 /DNA_START=72 /DNA_END=899 /DNA_ORIENTATION=-
MKPAQFIAALSVSAFLGALSVKPLRPKQSHRVTVDHVHVELYYETMCPFCRRFIAESMLPLWQDSNFSGLVSFELIPFGNAMAIPLNGVSEGYKYWHQDMIDKDIRYVFECQHMERECFGNAMHSCVMKYLPESIYLPFIACMEADEHDSLEKSSYQCAEQHGLNMTDLETIRSCTQGREGSILLAMNGNRTSSLVEPAGPKKYMPWVVVDGRHNERAEQDADKASGFLMEEVCLELKESVRPISCATHRAKSASAPTRDGRLCALAGLALASALH